MRWRPQYGGAMKPSSVITSTHADGLVQHWHVSSNKLMSEILEMRDSNINLYCSDYTNNGKFFLAAGNDRKVHVFDSMTREKVSSMH